MLNFNQYRALSERDMSGITSKGTTVEGIHYSHTAGLTHLSGSKFGSGIKGAEHRRLSEPGVDPRIKSRTYFYNRDTHKAPESGLGPHVHTATLHRIYNPETASAEHRAEVSQHRQKHIDAGHHPSNAFESAVVDSGYHGYTSNGMTVTLNHDHVPVHYEGHKQDLHQAA